MPGFSRMIYKAVGDLDCAKFKESGGMVEVDSSVIAGLTFDDKPFEEEVHQEYEKDAGIVLPGAHIIEIIDGKPNWILTEADIDCIAIGSGILGTGGGGSPYLASLVCKKLIREGKKLRIVSHQDFNADDQAAVIGGLLGAPTVCIEKTPSGNEMVDPVKLLIDALPEEKITAIFSMEIAA